ncbi:peptide chain release factor 2 [Patescibacteria group bacterium]|nr:peptide chain release factor 2 [Patescibacteria group bacterium]
MDDLKDRVRKILEKINVEEKRKEIRQIEAESLKPDFWQNHELAAKKMQTLSQLKKEIEEADKLEEQMASGDFEEAKKMLEKIEKLLYLSGPQDKGNAILSIHSGQGGVEAMDWAQMLFRMYSRYFEKKSWKAEVIDQALGEEVGFKSIVISVGGDYVFGHLKHESGVHRLVRQSPFNADSLRQTSFALVEVLPEIEEEVVLAIKDDDLEWDFFRSGGHGGQNVNKVSTAVRLKHIPSGIIVTSQSERYQGKNREYALKILKAKLWIKQEEERKKQEMALKGEHITPGWGNQIRSYVLHPYKMVKDLRTEYETSNTEAVLDGELDGFIEEELRLL